jgi:hypothetical protein
MVLFIKKLEFRLDAPDRLPLDQYRRRMDWIGAVANKYHDLMQGPRKHTMRAFLSEISSWSEQEAAP